MNKKTKLVLELLKTKASALGFNKEELVGAATTIASNLGVDDDATDEALNAAVEKAVAVYMPILELSQKNANRIITKNKEEREKAEAEAKKKAEEEAARKAAEEAEAKKKAEEEAAAKKAEEERKAAEEAGFQRLLDSDWAKGLKAENETLAKQLKEQSAAFKKQQEEAKKRMEEFESFRNEFNAMKADRVRATRQGRLDELVKDAGVYGERIKKNYAKMTFDSDEDFEEFLGGITEDIKAFNQERADKGLDTLCIPGAGGAKEEKEQKPMSEAEIEALAAIM